jgi:hypothetical protein
MIDEPTDGSNMQGNGGNLGAISNNWKGFLRWSRGRRPLRSSLIAQNDPKSPAAEAYRALRPAAAS